MIQLNLLPDVKLEYIKVQHLRRLVISVSIIVAAVAVAMLIILFAYNLAQKKHLSDLSKNITSEVNTLKQKPDLSKILTVQNQLGSLTALHSAKPAVSRLFDTYLDEVTPGTVSINNFSIDLNQDTVTLTGTADSLGTVNKYVDTLKFTKYSSKDITTPTVAFSNVVLSSFGLNTSSNSTNQAANYTINLSFDKNIFDITQQVNLTVPNLITTRSELAQPAALFNTAPANSQSNGSSSGGN